MTAATSALVRGREEHLGPHSAPVDAVASAASEAAKGALLQAGRDPLFLAVVDFLAGLPQEARGPAYREAMAARGITDLDSVPGILAGLADWIDAESLRMSHRLDIAEIGQSALLTAVSVELGRALPGLFDPTPAEIRSALGKLASGDRFAGLALPASCSRFWTTTSAVSCPTT